MSMTISPFGETDPFETGGTKGISRNALDNIRKEKITTVNFTDAAGNNSCSVCLQVKSFCSIIDIDYSFCLVWVA